MNTYTLENTMNLDSKKINIIISIAGPSDVINVKGTPILKHLIDINGEPFLNIFIKNLNIDGNYIFIIQKKYNELFNLKTIITSIVPKSKIVEIDGFKNGSASTLFELKNVISLESPVLFVNSDFTMDWNSSLFIKFIQDSKCDSCLVTYTSNSPKHAYCLVKDDVVINVIEKKVISDIAIVGVYYWLTGKILMDSIFNLISNKTNKNDIYYISESFNVLIKKNFKTLTYPVKSIKTLDCENDIITFTL